jgi:hypothetical protein
MRSLLGFLLFSAVLISILVFVAGPVVARPLVADVVRSALPFDGGDLVVAVDADGFDLLTGHVRAIRVSGVDLASGDVTIGSLDLTARRVGLLSRDVADLTGSIEDLTIGLEGGGSVTVASVDLAGSTSNVAAIANLVPAEAQSLVATALADAGLAVEGIVLTDDGLELELLGQRITVSPTVVDGAVALPSIMAGDAVPILAPADGDPWRITAITTSSAGLLVEATIDVAGYLAGG